MRNLTALVFLLVMAATRVDPAVAEAGVDGLRQPIIDMHLHAFRLDDAKPPA